MFDGLSAALLKDVGPEALLALTILMILYGALIPRWMHSERIKDLKEQNTLQQTALDRRDEQVNQLIDNDQLIIHLLESLKMEAERRSS